MKKGEIYEGIVQRVDFPDRAITKTDEGEEVLVKFGLPGQRIRFRLKRNKKSRPEGILLEVLSPADGEEPKQTCSHFGICGG